MTTAREFTDQVRQLFISPNGVSAADAANMAEQYANYCRMANDRLRRCADYLRRGLLAEAIHYAELKPDVLDLVGDLSLVEFDQWQTMCRQNGWDVPPPLSEDIAQDLNTAYNVHRPIETLLKKHRLLALARAPLSERLIVLRDLARMDPMNQVWEEDIKAFETARLKGIALEAKKAADAKDRKTLETLRNELTTSDWRIEGPMSYLNAIEKVLRSFVVKDVIVELGRLLDRLEQAHMAMSHEECEALTAEWERLLAEHRIRAPEEMCARAQPIFDWMVTQRYTKGAQGAFNQACADLEQALDMRKPTAELRKLYSVAKAFDQPIPGELHHRYENDMAAQDLARQRKTHLILVFTGLGVVAIAIAVILLVYSGIRHGHAQQWGQRIQTAIDKGELDRASSLWETLKKDDPKLLGRADLEDVRTRLDAAMARQEIDGKKFEAVIGEINLDDLVKNTAKEPIGIIRGKLAEAEKLGKTAKQQLRVTELRAKVNEIESNWQKGMDDALLADIDKLQKQFDALPPSALDGDLADYEKRLTSIKKELADIPTRHPNATARVLSILDPLLERSKEMDAALVRTREAAKRSQGQQ